MLFELSQLIFVLFLTAIAIVAYEMKASLRAPFCAECAHCRAARAAAERRDSELSDRYEQTFGWHHRDDQDPRD